MNKISSAKINKYYDQHIDQFGFSAEGVGWKNEKAQRDRFHVLTKIIDKPIFSINDLGCGTGAFYDFLLLNGYRSFSYSGYDILEQMISFAKKSHQNLPDVWFKRIENAHEMETADYCVASGIFSLQYDCPNEDWAMYILNTLSAMNKCSTSGFAFNMLTSYSDTDKTNPELYYANPTFIFDYCMKNFSRKVALLHDYEQYDFTILVKK